MNRLDRRCLLDDAMGADQGECGACGGDRSDCECAL